ncbi:hypothetical protein SK128_008362 [Halocaridina rubra]|uniref:Cuticle protein n=1 Tax=Halocaridina rubra TaxID=373956 RepID=A0AAN8WAL4_HALRR
MKVIAVCHIFQLTALAVSAAKLPLAPLSGSTQGAIRSPGNLAFQSVPAPPSTLYGAPLEDFPVPSQSHIVQTPAPPVPEISSISTLYEAPAKDLPSPIDTSSLTQNPISSKPSQGIFPDVSLTVPVLQPASLHHPAIEIQVPDIPSTLYELSSESTLKPLEQPSYVQSSVGTITVPTQTQTFVPNVGLTPAIQQPSLFEIPVVIPIPGEPSTLYELPDQSFALPSEPHPESQSPDDVYQQQPVSINTFGIQEQTPGIPTVIDSPQAPQQPSGLYEVPQEAQSTSNTNPVTLIKQTPDTFSHEVAVPRLPGGIYETPTENHPSSSYESVGVEHQPTGVPILFPEQTSFPNQSPIDLVPVPAFPSTLYETPRDSSLIPVQNPGKAIDVQSSPSENTYSAIPNSPVNDAIKGSVMMGMPYNFQWGVEDASGNAYTHQETSDGKLTSGQYRVSLPDGRIQVVTFYDNGNGFHAKVNYE